jgi:protein SCO1/2
MKLKACIVLFGLLSLRSLDSQSGADLALQVPDIEVVNQDGKQLRFSSEVLGNRIAVIDTIFTACTTICPVSGANFESLSKKLGDRLGRDVVLVSVSVDPLNDTPEHLKAWGAKFHADRGWTLVTGNKPDIDRLLKSLGLFAPERQDHPSTVLVGSAAAGWTRSSALGSPDKILKVIERMSSAPAQGKSAGEESSAAANYFTDVTLVDQDGQSRRFYSDLLKDKTVVINPFFTECKASCPVTEGKLLGLQKWLGDRLGKEVYILSISVDPGNDTPERLKAYAAKFEAKPGWYFLSGSKENVDFVLGRLGQKVNQRDDHLNILLIGNVPHQLWTKVPGIAATEKIIEVVEKISKNQG